MDNLGYVKNYLSKSLAVKKELVEDEKLIEKIKDVAELIEKKYRQGNKLLIAGNGGSAADSQHIAAEFVSRFFYDRPGLPAIALTTDTSMLTAIGNDYGYRNLFSRQIQAQGNSGDVFIGISTSGNSENIIEAVNEAKKLELTTMIGLFWGNYMMHNPTLIRETQQRLYALYDKGTIKPVIHQADKMDQLQQSLELLANRRIHGKLVLVNPVSG